MIRYRLDDLGWFQFEWLVQSLLKEHLGIGVQSWGSHSDWGRDAWCRGPLSFPSRDKPSPGPFLFQVKFVENANSSGAKPLPALLKAVKAECSRSRAASFHARQNYVLITNAPLSAKGRDSAEKMIRDSMPLADVHCLAGNDVCDLLDASPAIRRAFPQILSLRDLDAFLRDAVSADLIKRSAVAISQAKDLVSVFVPTSTYMQTWEVLRRRHFAVLEGPPEMGKSAIAWMIALSRIADQWEALFCESPSDFFHLHRPDEPQIFIADDAFGRTEYDPSRGFRWEADLHRVLSLLNRQHWLVWTSRRHILERAKNRMDLQGAAVDFPKPGEVIVDTSQLEVQEIALMLYRHARAASLNDQARSLVKKHCASIVKSPYVTPERIRRFVRDVSGQTRTGQADGNLGARLVRALENPTDGMKKSYHALSLDHKRMLLRILEMERYCSVDKLLDRFRRMSSSSELDANQLLEEVKEAFVKVSDSSHAIVDWIHPSYRDLVIEQLREGSLRREFLDTMDLVGIKLALSGTGGADGSRRFPLVLVDEDWGLLQDRCLAVVGSKDLATQVDLLFALSEGMRISEDKERERLRSIATRVCEATRSAWDAQGAGLRSSAIAAYAQASEWTSPLVPMPKLEASWRAAREELRKDCNNSNDFLLESYSFAELMQVAKTIERTEPRLLRALLIPDELKRLAKPLIDNIQKSLSADREYTNGDDYEVEADGCFDLAKLLEKFIGLVPKMEEELRELMDDLIEHANRCRSFGDEAFVSPEADPDVEGLGAARAEVDVAELFQDL